MILATLIFVLILALVFKSLGMAVVSGVFLLCLLFPALLFLVVPAASLGIYYLYVSWMN